MRIGLILDRGREGVDARLAETKGLFGVLAGLDDPVASMNGAVYASSTTSAITVIARVELGTEHPVTISEEIAVLDNVNAGRTVVLADTGGLDTAAAAEEIEIIRRALACRPLRFEGRRFTVPAGIPTNVGTAASISVTPKPAQLEVPFWLMGDAADEVAKVQNVARIATGAADCDPERLVQPAIVSATGQMDDDRDMAIAWESAGATHLLMRPPAEVDLGAFLTTVSRFVIPEVAMPDYPRLLSEAPLPLAWPGSVAHPVQDGA